MPKSNVKSNVVKKENTENGEPFMLDLSATNGKKQLSKFEEFTQRLGVDATLEDLKQAEEMLKITTVNGDVSLKAFKIAMLGKLHEYYSLGIAREVKKMMEEQASLSKSKNPNLRMVSDYDVMLILVQMADKELRYGLMPFEHMIPLNKKIYITFQGRLYYAMKTGKFAGFDPEETKIIKDGSKDGHWIAKACVVKMETTRAGETIKLKYYGEGEVLPYEVENNKSMRKNAKHMAMKRAKANALKEAFPIGYDEITDSVIDKDFLEELQPISTQEMKQEISTMTDFAKPEELVQKNTKKTLDK